MPGKLLIVLSVDPPGLGEELAGWSADHAEEMLELPGINAAQAFRIDDGDMEAPGSRPPYTNLVVYECDDDFKGLAFDPENLPTPPGGMGPNRPDGFIFKANGPRWEKPSA